MLYGVNLKIQEMVQRRKATGPKNIGVLVRKFICIVFDKRFF